MVVAKHDDDLVEDVDVNFFDVEMWVVTCVVNDEESGEQSIKDYLKVGFFVKEYGYGYHQ